MKQFILYWFLFTATTLGLHAEDFREFKSPDGKVIEAKILEVKEDKVTIQMKSGKVMTASISYFSDTDKAYIRAWKPSTNAEASSKPAGLVFDIKAVTLNGVELKLYLIPYASDAAREQSASAMYEKLKIATGFNREELAAHGILLTRSEINGAEYGYFSVGFETEYLDPSKKDALNDAKNILYKGFDGTLVPTLDLDFSYSALSKMFGTCTNWKNRKDFDTRRDMVLESSKRNKSDSDAALFMDFILSNGVKASFYVNLKKNKINRISFLGQKA